MFPDSPPDCLEGPNKFDPHIAFTNKNPIQMDGVLEMVGNEGIEPPALPV